MRTVIERFLSKIKVSESGCWVWIASTNTKGYGQFRDECTMKHAHRFIYEYYYGDLDSNLVVHHKCYNRKCVNPLHLKQMTIRKNILDVNSKNQAAVNSRKTHCIRGHEFTPENTYVPPSEGRICRKCANIRYRGFHLSTTHYI